MKSRATLENVISYSNKSMEPSESEVLYAFSNKSEGSPVKFQPMHVQSVHKKQPNHYVTEITSAEVMTQFHLPVLEL